MASAVQQRRCKTQGDFDGFRRKVLTQDVQGQFLKAANVAIIVIVRSLCYVYVVFLLLLSSSVVVVVVVVAVVVEWSRRWRATREHLV